MHRILPRDKSKEKFMRLPTCPASRSPGEAQGERQFLLSGRRALPRFFEQDPFTAEVGQSKIHPVNHKDHNWRNCPCGHGGTDQRSDQGRNEPDAEDRVNTGKHQRKAKIDQVLRRHRSALHLAGRTDLVNNLIRPAAIRRL